MSRTESLSRARQRAADIRRLCYLREERDAQRTLVKRLNSFGNTFRALHLSLNYIHAETVCFSRQFL